MVEKRVNEKVARLEKLLVAQLDMSKDEQLEVEKAAQ